MAKHVVILRSLYHCLHHAVSKTPFVGLLRIFQWLPSLALRSVGMFFRDETLQKNRCHSSGYNM